MRTSSTLAGVLTALVLVSGCLPTDDAVPGIQPGAEVEREAPAAVPSPSASAERDADLLQAAPGGDGDSWRDSSGKQYRLGLVDTPEVGRCFASEATAERVRHTADGFRADVYSVDRYGRSVSVVTSAGGVNLNVHLARHGFATDRYLEQFRHENRSLAGQLDEAFAAAKAERAGLWGACGQAQGSSDAPPPAAEPAAAQPAAAQAPTSSDCHPDYTTCIPVKGDGSGRGDANDLDCGDIGHPVQLRQRGVDPYRLDGDGDGVGCTG